MANYKETCPYCESWNLGYSEELNDEDEKQLVVFCHDCYEEWVDDATPY